jgi:predicted  nucleic acid-binding Zn-ribbon protein
VITCTDCGQSFDPRDSMMGDEGQCQGCWEKECDRSWWSYHNALAAAHLWRIRQRLAERTMRHANPQLYGRAATGLPKRAELLP